MTKAPPFLRTKPSHSDAGPRLIDMLEALPGKIGKRVQEVAACEIAVGLRGRAGSYAGEALDAFQGKALACEFAIEDWGAAVHILLERDALYACLEAVLGGEAAEPADQPERAFTALESAVARLMCETMAAALQDEFAQIPGAALSLRRVDHRLDTLTRDDRAGPGQIVSFELSVGRVSGAFHFLLPYALVSRVNASTFVNEASEQAQDAWRAGLIGAVERAPVQLTAMIREEGFRLADVTAMKPGQVLRLGPDAAGRIVLCAGERPLYRCSLGRGGAVYSVRVEQAESEGAEEALVQ